MTVAGEKPVLPNRDCSPVSVTTTLVHARPVHVVNAASPFSKEATDQNYRGFLHLSLLLLFVNLLRLVMENFMKYGILLSIPGRDIPMSDLAYAIFAISTLSINIVISFWLEWTILNYPNLAKPQWYLGVIVLNIGALIFVPSWIVWTRMYHLVVGSIAVSLALVLCMKIVSYHVVNFELRQRWKDRIGQDPYPDCPYPNNITIGNAFYFWIAPTLCYQSNYPQSSSFRIKFFSKRILEFVVVLSMMHIMIDQYAVPTMQSSIKPMTEKSMIGMLERVLKLSVSSLYIWLLGFYALFHSFLNAFAELVGFGDRTFYSAWWNARTIDEYWRLWNAPVHQWLKRHVYVPLRARGWPSFVAQDVIFLLSAIAHEYLVAVPTNIVQGWAFSAMLLQLPLISFTSWYMKRHPNSSVGNYIFWIAFCILGQPMIILLYYRAWVTRTSSSVFFFF